MLPDSDFHSYFRLLLLSPEVIASVGSTSRPPPPAPGFNPLATPELSTVMGVVRGVMLAVAESFFLRGEGEFRVNLHMVFRLSPSPQNSLIQWF